MRQTIKISLLLVYVLFCAGQFYSLHFCGEESKDISWLDQPTPCCDAEEQDCCEDVFYSEILPSDQQFKQAVDFQFLKISLPLGIIHTSVVEKFYHADLSALAPRVQQEDQSPPRALYIEHQVFLI